MNSNSSTQIALTRRPDQFGAFMNLKVFVDGKVVGELPYRTRLIFPVNPGDHKVHTKMEMNYIKSAPISIHVTEGETVELNCGSRFHGWTWILNVVLPTALEIQHGTFKLNNVKSGQQPLKRPLLFLLPTILMPVFLVYIALIVVVLLSSEGLFTSIFGSHAAIAQLLFMLLSLGMLIGLTAVRFWKWFSRYL